MLIINTEKQIPRAETKSEERNQGQEVQEKQIKRGREITESMKFAKEGKINKTMKTERKEKSRYFKLMIWKKIKGNVRQSFLRKPTHSAVETKFKNKTRDAYINSTAVSRTNAELDKHSKSSKKINLVPENQTKSLERQPDNRKGLELCLTVVKKVPSLIPSQL